MAPPLRFDRRVVVITGAGGGLGRAYALAFAARGASVLVNDLMNADAVVQEIRSSGGTAHANNDSVEQGDAIIAATLKAFGKVDIVINNAGMLRDKSFSRMTREDWHQVMNVHLRGSYKVTKAAWEVMRQQGYGRIVMTASGAGIYGNVGQVNYAAAKLGLAGFAFTLAREGAKNNVHCNVIAPLAASKMTENLLPPEILAALKPEKIAQVVMYLSHESCQENGGLFECGAGFVTKLRWQRAQGLLLKTDASLTPSAVAAQDALLDQVDPVSRPAVYPESITDQDWIGLVERGQGLSSAKQGAPISFKNRVAIVTGAGAGLGRTYALLLAGLGCKVVVNDLGTAHTGTGASHQAADAVVQEIQARGGEAVANYDSVEQGEKIVEQALKAFGRVDILINNAGILRDKSFSRMTDQDWDLVMRVHLHGTFALCHAAWPVMVKQKFGRIVNTASAVGLYGNFGQANYSAAKLALVGMTNALAREGERYNILCNTIAPNAGTRMTATVMPAEVVNALKPDYVAPFVVYLTSDVHQRTGQVFEVGSGWMGRVQWQQSHGAVGHTVEALQQHWDKVVDFSRVRMPTSLQESLMLIVEASQEMSNNQNSNVIQPIPIEKVFPYSYSPTEVILYNLSTGAQVYQDLSLLYEQDESFHALPTFAVIPVSGGLLEVPLDQVLPPFELFQLLHGEQFIQLHQEFPLEGHLESKASVVQVEQKKGGVVVVIRMETRKENQLLATNESSLFIRGIKVEKSFQCPRSKEALNKNEPPKGKRPSFVVKQRVTREAAALYRLTGDRNPLHIDPSVASMGGFQEPILHGLCTLGYAVRHVLTRYPGAVDTIKVRFAKHVFPGDEIETQMWLDSDKKVLFQVVVPSREQVVVLAGGAITFKSAIQQAKL